MDKYIQFHSINIYSLNITFISRLTIPCEDKEEDSKKEREKERIETLVKNENIDSSYILKQLNIKIFELENKNKKLKSLNIKAAMEKNDILSMLEIAKIEKDAAVAKTKKTEEEKDKMMCLLEKFEKSIQETDKGKMLLKEEKDEMKCLMEKLIQETDIMRMLLKNAETKKDDMELIMKKEEKKKNNVLLKLKELVVCPVCLVVPRTEKLPVCENEHTTCLTCKRFVHCLFVKVSIHCTVYVSHLPYQPYNYVYRINKPWDLYLVFSKL